jgi:hypothetical protein
VLLFSFLPYMVTLICTTMPCMCPQGIIEPPETKVRFNASGYACLSVVTPVKQSPKVSLHTANQSVASGAEHQDQLSFQLLISEFQMNIGSSIVSDSLQLLVITLPYTYVMFVRSAVQFKKCLYVISRGVRHTLT